MALVDHQNVAGGTSRRATGAHRGEAAVRASQRYAAMHLRRGVPSCGAVDWVDGDRRSHVAGDDAREDAGILLDVVVQTKRDRDGENHALEILWVDQTVAGSGIIEAFVREFPRVTQAAVLLAIIRKRIFLNICRGDLLAGHVA
jgi:hypothetical protein